MALLVKLSILLSISSLGLAGLARGVAEVNNDYPGMCWVSSKGKAFAPGSSWPLEDGRCGRVDCVESEGKLNLLFVTCGRGTIGIGTGNPCHEVARTAASYPECCPVKVCVPPEMFHQIVRKNGYEIIS
ncbi:uncharacterized protein [Palaemon carinicauda]|uniref:uncharacterized protein n=1 Tax=Palaemon carinicauda TaxID=392227 RepID=UPI0035B5B848